MSLIQRINPNLFEAYLQNIGSDHSGVLIMGKKAHDFVFQISQLPLSAMHILKQEALSVGADLALPKEAILCQKTHYDALLFGSFSQISRIAQKCLSQPFGLSKIGKKLQSHLLAPPQRPPKLMAILNLTPDSFYQKSRFDCQKALETIQCYIKMGVEIIDIGGASSRPQSELISAQEELERLRELILLIAQQELTTQALFSIDTYNPEVADFALSHGFKILNDILGFSHPLMFEICAKHQACAILMHSRGTPKTMQSLTHYSHLFAEVDDFFEHKIAECKTFGIQEIILDIGFGFAKDLEHNLCLIQNLSHFRHFGFPLLVGASRKNTIGILTQQSIENRLSGTLALHQLALQNGAEILRVHDIQEHLDMIAIHNAMGKIWTN